MPKGPKGEKRPADVIGAAVMVAKIATGEVEDEAPDDGKNKAAQELGRLGGKARASKLTKEQRMEKRPADVIGAAVMVAKIATGEVEDEAPDDGKNKAAQELGRLGGKARASKLTKEQRMEIAKKAARSRWER